MPMPVCIFRGMSAIAHIRKQVLGISQAALAEIAGVTQATVSRWEKGELVPDLNALSRVRTAAREKDPAFDERWFFEVPPVDTAPQPEAA